MLNFGFSYVGLIFLIMLFVPNGLWTKNKPQNYDEYVKNENRILLIFERVGEVLVSCMALIFKDFNFREINPWSAWLWLAIASMLCYEAYWIRYFKSQKRMEDFYSSFLGVPVAGATYPVIAFLCLGIYGSNIFMLIAVLILAIGHIGIHLVHKKEVCTPDKKKLFVKIFTGIISVLIAIIILLCTVTIGIRNVIYIKNHVRGDNAIEEEVFLDINGQKQYCLIRGEDVNNPVVIWIHGGPASPDTMDIYYLTNYLKDDYTVIAWNQRGCGRTYFKNQSIDPDNSTASFEQLQDDLDVLVDYARERFGQAKVIIVGHSFGTMVGSDYSVNHPEKVEKYVGVGQMGAKGSDKVAANDALEKAKALGDDTVEFEKAVGAYEQNPSIANMLTVRGFADKYHKPDYEKNYIIDAIFSPYMGINDIRWFMKQLSVDAFVEQNKLLFDYITEHDVYDFDMEYKVPVVFISGSCDWVTPVSCMKDYCDAIDAPSKTVHLIDGWGHSVPQENPQGFAKILKELL